MKLIGITGSMGSGKTSLAEVLEEQGYTRKAFAEPLYWIAKRYMFWDGVKDDKGRKLLQTLGTECGRTYNPNVWVKHMEIYIESRLKMEQVAKYKDPVNIVIDDVRFENEANLIRELGGKVIHLQGKGYDMGELNNHASEQGVKVDTEKDIVLSYQRFNSKDLFKEVVTEDLVRLGFINAN